MENVKEKIGTVLISIVIGLGLLYFRYTSDKEKRESAKQTVVKAERETIINQPKWEPPKHVLLEERSGDEIYLIAGISAKSQFRDNFILDMDRQVLLVRQWGFEYDIEYKGKYARRGQETIFNADEGRVFEFGPQLINVFEGKLNLYGQRELFASYFQEHTKEIRNYKFRFVADDVYRK